jgi:hypothetical protein
VTLLGNEGPPVVERVSPGGAAAGRLQVGDYILRVNDTEADGHGATTKLLKRLQGDIQLCVSRGKL